jgi:hypothetical protein
VLVFVIYGGSMFDDNDHLIDDLKIEIYQNYPSVNINVVRNENNEYFFSINNREVYYSEDFQLFLMKLKKDMLWKKNIYNVFFSLDEIVNKINDITFSKNILTTDILDWKADNISIRMNTNISYEYQLMAA